MEEGVYAAYGKVPPESKAIPAARLPAGGALKPLLISDSDLTSLFNQASDEVWLILEQVELDQIGQAIELMDGAGYVQAMESCRNITEQLAQLLSVTASQEGNSLGARAVDQLRALGLGDELATDPADGGKGTQPVVGPHQDMRIAPRVRVLVDVHLSQRGLPVREIVQIV